MGFSEKNGLEEMQEEAGTSMNIYASDKEKRIQEKESLIEEEKENIDSSAKRIGKIVHEALQEKTIEDLEKRISGREDCSFPFVVMSLIYAELIKVKKAENQINEYENQIFEIKNEGLCPNCGSKVEENSAFCSVCGFNLKKPLFEENIICHKCKKLLPKDAVFCLKCGTRVGNVQEDKEKIDEQSIFIEAQPAVEQKPEKSEVSSEMDDTPNKSVVPEKKVCRNCGAEVMPGYLFCEICGVKVEE